MCSPNADCIDLQDINYQGVIKAMYKCICQDGFQGNGFKCREKKQKKCEANFGQKLKRLKVSDVRKPISFRVTNSSEKSSGLIPSENPSIGQHKKGSDNFPDDFPGDFPDDFPDDFLD